jgi:hypothetical protein
VEDPGYSFASNRFSAQEGIVKGIKHGTNFFRGSCGTVYLKNQYLHWLQKGDQFGSQGFLTM